MIVLSLPITNRPERVDGGSLAFSQGPGQLFPLDAGLLDPILVERRRQNLEDHPASSSIVRRILLLLAKIKDIGLRWRSLWKSRLIP
jgi:hypothetical protein